MVPKFFRCRVPSFGGRGGLLRLQVSLCLAALLFLVGCSGDGPVRIGFVAGLTGRVADLGISGRDGVILAVEERNREGGINGRLVELVVEDDRQEPETAARALATLVERNVAAVIGHMTSSMAVATLPLANKHRLVMMSPTVTTIQLSGIDDYFFRTCATTDTYSAQMARYFRNVMGLARVSVVYDLGNKAYTESWMLNFNKEFERLGGRIARIDTFTSGPDVHFAELAEQILGQETEGIIISAGAADAAMIAQQVRKKNGTVAIGTSEWASTEKLIELGGGAVEGAVVSQFFDRYSLDPRYQRFRSAFKERFAQEPGFASVGGYDAAMVLFEALARKKNQEELKDVILAIGTFAGLQGEIRIDPNGDSGRPTFLSVISNGRFVRAQ